MRVLDYFISSGPSFGSLAAIWVRAEDSKPEGFATMPKPIMNIESRSQRLLLD